MPRQKRIATKYPGVFYVDAQRKGGSGLERVYYVRFRKNGKMIEEPAGRQYADNMTSAKANRIRGELIEGKRKTQKEQREELEAKKQVWTISALWEKYKANNPELKGIVTDENRFQNYLKPSLGKKEPKDIVPLDVDRLRLKLLRDRKPATVRNVLELLRRIANFGVKKNLCDGFSFTIEMPKVNNLKTEDLNADELQSLLAAMDEDHDPQVVNFMKMVLFTGMRRGELFKLEWRDIDFDRGFILLRDPKGELDQKIPLSDGAREILTNHISPYPESPFIFPGRSGERRKDINKQVNRIKKRAGLPDDFRPLHGLRHAYASMLANSGEVDMFTLQKLLTHKSATMTQRYAHLRDDALKRASSVADSIVNGVGGKKKSKDNVIKIVAS